MKILFLALFICSPIAFGADASHTLPIVTVQKEYCPGGEVSHVRFKYQKLSSKNDDKAEAINQKIEQKIFQGWKKSTLKTCRQKSNPEAYTVNGTLSLNSNRWVKLTLFEEVVGGSHNSMLRYDISYFSLRDGKAASNKDFFQASKLNLVNQAIIDALVKANPDNPRCKRLFSSVINTPLEFSETEMIVTYTSDRAEAIGCEGGTVSIPLSQVKPYLAAGGPF